jgi:protocatechuate 3,4-dioxygenase beta subunit
LIGRRTALLGAAGFTWGCARPGIRSSPGNQACLLTPEQVEGPYYLDDAKVRRDIREGKSGVPLQVALRLLDVRSCGPLKGAAVDLWHCDGEGSYSGFTADSSGPRGDEPGFGPPPGPGFGTGRPPPPPRPGGPPRGGPPGGHRSDAFTFLRGIQLSDANGELAFATIYPGWYQGRAVHIHLRVRTDGALAAETYQGGHIAHTGQLYFAEDVSDRVFALPPYASHSGRRLRHEDDSIFKSGGAAGLVTLSPLEGDAGGYLASAVVGLNPTATPPIER